MVNAQVTAENNPAYPIPLDSFHMHKKPVTHEDQVFKPSSYLLMKSS